MNRKKIISNRKTGFREKNWVFWYVQASFSGCIVMTIWAGFKISGRKILHFRKTQMFYGNCCIAHYTISECFDLLWTLSLKTKFYYTIYIIIFPFNISYKYRHRKYLTCIFILKFFSLLSITIILMLYFNYCKIFRN